MDCPECNGNEFEVVPAISGCQQLGISPSACKKCGLVLWRDNSRVIDRDGNEIFFKAGKLFSRNKKGEMIRIESEIA